MKRKLLSLLLAVSLLSGCTMPMGAPQETVPTEAKERFDLEEQLRKIHSLGESPEDAYRTYYEIYVYSFCDSDEDGIGDLQGVISRLDYLQNLGITGLRLLPIQKSPCYHKYDTEDYCSVDPSYGSLEDFDLLLAEAKKRGMKVVLDLTLNQTGQNHPWFLTACRYLSSLKPEEKVDEEVCPEVSCYHFRKSDTCPGGYYAVPGAEGYYYEGTFGDSMPDLNLQSQELRQRLQKVMAFWLQRGADGFCLPGVRDYCASEPEKNLEVLSWFASEAKKLKADCFLGAEIEGEELPLSAYYKSGITSLFYKGFAEGDGSIAEVLRSAGNASDVSAYAKAQEEEEKAIREITEEYVNACILSDHETGRAASLLKRKESKLKLAGAMNLFLSGSAFVYYGEELGMICGKGGESSCFAPMYWNPLRTDGTTQPPPGCAIPETYTFGSVEKQMTDENSIYNYYRQAIAIRNAIPSIARGIPTEEWGLNRETISACRKSWGEETSIILLNISDGPAVADLTGYEDYALSATLTVDEQQLLYKDGSLYFPPFGAAVLTQK